MRFTVAVGLLVVCGFGSGAVVTETECPYLVLVEESKIMGSLQKAHLLKKAHRAARAAVGSDDNEHSEHAKALANHPGMSKINKTEPRIVAFITTPSRTSPINLTAIENVQYICADGMPARHVQQLRHCCNGFFNIKTKKCDSACRAASAHKSRPRRTVSYTRADLHSGLKKVGSWFLYWFKIIFGFFFVMNNIQV